MDFNTKCVVVVVALFVIQLVKGDPCTDGSHSCDPSSQRCVDQNNTVGYICQCIKVDQQLDSQQNCTDIPDRQRLYLSTPINTTGADIELVFQILSDPKYSEEALRKMYSTLTITSYKDVKFIEYRVGTIPDFRYAIYTLLFTENITTEIKQAVARSVLIIEQVGTVDTNNITVAIAGHTGIFDTEDDARGDVDDVDWCSSPSLYLCRENSSCRDVGLRYECPCYPGFVDDGVNCYVCSDDFHFGDNCAKPCDCIINKTVSCDHINGTCYCMEPWEGVTCDADVNECLKNPEICGSPFFQCVNTVGGYDCVCADNAVLDVATGACLGALISGPSGPFDTDGSRDLHLLCEVYNVSEVTQYTWSRVCVQQDQNRCTIKPHRSENNNTVTCTVTYKNGQSASADFVLDLNYPPGSAPVISGYTTGQELRVGDTLKMRCSVHGGKPLVTSVDFSCPHHSDAVPDVTGISVVTSVLEIELTPEDDGAECECTARWKGESWYTQSSSEILVVKKKTETVVPLDFKWWIVISVMGFFLVVLIIMAACICKMRASGTKEGNSSSSGELPRSKYTGTGAEAAFATMAPPRPHNFGPRQKEREVQPLPDPGLANGRTAMMTSSAPDILDQDGNRIYQDRNRINRDSIASQSSTYDRLVTRDSLPTDPNLDLYLHAVTDSRQNPTRDRQDAVLRSADAVFNREHGTAGTGHLRQIGPSDAILDTQYGLW